LYDYAKQIESLNALVAAMGEDTGSDIYVMRAIAQRNDGNTDAALVDFDKALQIDPTSAYALAERGWTKDMLYKDREALKDYNAAITYAEPNAWIYLQRGRMYQAIGDSIKAQTDFEQALQLDTVSSTQAFALFYLGDTDQAIAFMNAIIAENPEDAGEYYNLACLYALANKKQEAVDALKLAIELGYKSYNHIRLDRDLTNIREEQAYQDILNKITKSKISKMFEEIGR
jgi:tetratricopeptide (TPR) repeat protein